MDINYSPLGFLISFFFIVTFLVPQVKSRAFYVFGDSLVDNGNNDYLVTTARADNYPYGIDYPTRRPTGRFSNGLNIPDIISEAIGMPSTLPYLSPQLTGENLLVGANFASAGIGILNDTGIQFVNIIRISKQFEYFEQYQQRVSALIGPEATQQLVNQALVLITLGGNDFVNNYYLIPFSARSRQFALPDYVVYLISEYGKILRKLYELGARRVLVTGTGAMGCAPAELAQHSRNGECYGALQTAAALFNPRLVDLIASVNAEIGQDVFVAANAYQMNMDYLSNPEQFDYSKMATTSTGDIEKTKSVEVKKKLNVLIVDDDAIVRKLHERIINAFGGISQTAKNGEEAVNIHRNGDASFDLILMDKEMPVRDGASATKKLREMKVTSMIVGVTTLADDEEKRKAFMEAGLDHCFAKPLNKDKIQPLINKLMDA